MAVLNIYHLKGVIPKDAVYIGRANRKLNLPDSGWGNPFVLNDPTQRELVCAQYQQWLDVQVSTGAITVEQLLTLANKDLVCFCAPKMCHGHVLAEKVAWAQQQREACQTPPVSTETSSAPKVSRWKRV